MLNQDGGQRASHGSLTAMAGRSVQLRIGGNSYRVVTSATDDQLQRLVAVVEGKLAMVSPPGKPVTPQAMLLAAIALANDLEEERARSAELTSRARGVFGKLLNRVDSALKSLPESGDRRDGER